MNPLCTQEVSHCTNTFYADYAEKEIKLFLVCIYIHSFITIIFIFSVFVIPGVVL